MKNELPVSGLKNAEPLREAKPIRLIDLMYISWQNTKTCIYDSDGEVLFLGPVGDFDFCNFPQLDFKVEDIGVKNNVLEIYLLQGEPS